MNFLLKRLIFIKLILFSHTNVDLFSSISKEIVILSAKLAIPSILSLEDASLVRINIIKSFQVESVEFLQFLLFVSQELISLATTVSQSNAPKSMIKESAQIVFL